MSLCCSEFTPHIYMLSHFFFFLVYTIYLYVKSHYSHLLYKFIFQIVIYFDLPNTFISRNLDTLYPRFRYQSAVYSSSHQIFVYQVVILKCYHKMIHKLCHVPILIHMSSCHTVVCTKYLYVKLSYHFIIYQIYIHKSPANCELLLLANTGESLYKILEFM